jgi:uroporphyrinogen decarboxylase
MNSIERSLAVLNGQIPDRVPVSLPNFLVTARLMGTDDYAAFFQDGEAMAEGQIKAWQRYGHDVVIIENGTAALAQACGVNVIYQSDTAPVAKEPAIASLEDVGKLVIPDPQADPILRQMLLATRIVAQEIGDRAFIMGRADQGPFSLACEIRGMDKFMMDIATNEEPEKIHQLLDFCRQVVTRYAFAQIEAGAHLTSIGDSPSGPDMLSPRAYRKFAHPYVKQMAAELKAHNVILSYHICGNATPIIADMVASGAPIIEIDQKADQKTCKAAAHGKAALMGPIDPSGVMANGTPEDVRARCREALETLAPGGGFFLGSGCALPATTPDDNILAMVEAAKMF